MSLHQFDGERLGDLENGRIDLALGAPIQFEKMPFLITRTIVRDRFISAVGPGGQVARDLDDFCGRDHVLVSGEGGGFDGLVDHALAALGRRRRVALSVQSYLLAIEAVAASDMIVTLPGALLTKGWRNLILFEPVLPLPSFTLSAAWHPRMDSASAHRWLRDQLAHVCRC
jgi:DNA-binding transcriptional LysR family regulator